MNETRGVNEAMGEPSRPELRVPVVPLREGRSALDEPTSRYLVRVHRMRAGDRFFAFDPESALEGDARIVSDRLPHAEIEIDSVRATTARPARRTTLLQAVGKGDKPEQVVRDATVLGATRVVFVETERCVARASGEGKKVRERRVAVEAARQAGRGDLPELLGPTSLPEAFALVADAPRKLVFCWHPESRAVFDALEGWSEEEELVLLIGPEGGLAPEEIEAARGAGFAPVSLGPFVLRTETAATVALGVVQSYAAARSSTSREELALASPVSP